MPWPTDAERPGPDCYCGKQGCIEQWLSGVAFAADHRRATGEDLTAAEVAAAATDERLPARASLNRYVDRLARALATIIDVADPDVIVLGGGMSNVAMLYEEVPALWPQYVFGGEALTRLVPNHHGDSSGVRGAAMLVPI